MTIHNFTVICYTGNPTINTEKVQPSLMLTEDIQARDWVFLKTMPYPQSQKVVISHATVTSACCKCNV